MSRSMTPQEALPKIREIIRAGGSCRVVVTGTSMVPLLRHKKDAVILSPLSGPAKKGDILFHVRGTCTCILHRVVKVYPDGAMDICGDAQIQPERVLPRQVVGIVTQVERNGKRFPCTTLLWRMICSLWMFLRPVRPQLLAVMGKLSLIKTRIIR